MPAHGCPEALLPVVHALLEEGEAELVGLDDPLPAVRAIHRAWLEGRPWGPLVVLDGAHTPDAATAIAAVRAAPGGVVFVRRGVPRAGLRGACRQSGAALLTEGEGPPPRELDLRALAAWDDVAVVASDPTLVRARAALLAWAARGEVAYLRGPPGSGRASLFRWAAVAGGAEAVDVVTRARPAPLRNHAWALFRDVETLGAESLAGLAGRLEPPAPVLRIARRGQRPDHPAAAALLGEDAALCEALALALRHAPGRAPVLILGETGTGKEPTAKLVHDASGRRGRLVAVDLAARNPRLLDDELFGHVKDAFTDARSPRDGAFRQADGGTLFIDELGNLPLELQAKLLRVLQTGEVVPLGSDRPVKVNVRLVAATNADLEGMVRAGQFREDLYHRLAGVLVRLPPLRERGDDVVLLAKAFARSAETPARLHPDTLAVLRTRRWPGNVRELEREIEWAARETPDGVVRPEHLRDHPRGGRPPVVVTGSVDPTELPDSLGRRAAQALAALTLNLPAPAERGEPCLLNAVLHGLAGRPVQADALRALLSWPWWGNFLELDRRLAVLRALPPGPLSLDLLRRALPDMSAEAPRRAMISLVYASLAADGGLHGWRRVHHAGALVIGRVHSRADLPASSARARALADWLDGALDDAAPEFLAFPHLAELSRVHAVVLRRGAELVVKAPEGLGLKLHAGPVGGVLRAAEGAEELRLGEVGELRIERERERDPYLQVFVATDEDALTAVTALVLARLPGAPTDTRRDRAPQHTWALDDDELAALNAAVLEHVRGAGDFAPALREAMRGWPPPLDRLRRALSSANPSQSASRFYENPENGPLRRALRAALDEEADAGRVAERLPARLAARVLTTTTGS